MHEPHSKVDRFWAGRPQPAYDSEEDDDEREEMYLRSALAIGLQDTMDHFYGREEGEEEGADVIAQRWFARGARGAREERALSGGSDWGASVDVVSDFD